MVRRGAGLNANQAWRQLLKECQHLATLQLAADDHLTRGINAVYLETDLAMSKSIVVIVCMARSSESWELRGTHVPVEEPSTASQTDAFLAKRNCRRPEISVPRLRGWRSAALGGSSQAADGRVATFRVGLVSVRRHSELTDELAAQRLANSSFSFLSAALLICSVPDASDAALARRCERCGVKITHLSDVPPYRVAPQPEYFAATAAIMLSGKKCRDGGVPRLPSRLRRPHSKAP